MGLEPPPPDRLILCPLSPQEKCVNCSRKFRCTQGYQLEVRKKGPSSFRTCSTGSQAPEVSRLPSPAPLTRAWAPGQRGPLDFPGGQEAWVRSAQRRPHSDSLGL